MIIVHRMVVVLGIANPVIPELSKVAVEIIAVPVVTVQLPVPTVGKLPDNVVLLTLHKLWSAPALATLGNSST